MWLVYVGMLILADFCLENKMLTEIIGPEQIAGLCL